MKKILCVFLMLIIVAALSAENEMKAYQKYNEALGFQYGEISGTGISYYLMLGRLGFQFAGGVLYFPDTNESFLSDNLLDYVIGAEVQFEVYGNDFFSWLSSRVYTYAGICHRGYIPTIVNEYIEDPDDPSSWVTTYERGAFTQTITVGAGIGIEIIFFQHLSIPVELGYGLTWNSTLGSTFLDQIEQINLLPQVGFRYRY